MVIYPSKSYTCRHQAASLSSFIRQIHFFIFILKSYLYGVKMKRKWLEIQYILFFDVDFEGVFFEMTINDTSYDEKFFRKFIL